MPDPNYTLSALELQPAPGHQSRAEWIRVHQVVAQYNISRSFIYALLQQQTIRSISLRKRGNIRGIRLISRASLDLYLERLAIDQKEVCS